MLVALALVTCGAFGTSVARAASPAIPQAHCLTDQLAGPPLMGLGAELDPYDTVSPSQIALRTVGRRLRVTSTGQVFIVRSGRVAAVGLAARRVLAKPGALQAAVRLAGVP